MLNGKNDDLTEDNSVIKEENEKEITKDKKSEVKASGDEISLVEFAYILGDVVSNSNIKTSPKVNIQNDTIDTVNVNEESWSGIDKISPTKIDSFSGVAKEEVDLSFLSSVSSKFQSLTTETSNLISDVASGTVKVAGKVASNTIDTASNVANGTLEVAGKVASGTLEVTGEVLKVAGSILEGL